MLTNHPYFGPLLEQFVSGCQVRSHGTLKLDEDERGISLTDSPGGKQEALVVAESGLYSLVLCCREHRDAVTKLDDDEKDAVGLTDAIGSGGAETGFQCHPDNRTRLAELIKTHRVTCSDGNRWVVRGQRGEIWEFGPNRLGVTLFGGKFPHSKGHPNYVEPYHVCNFAWTEENLTALTELVGLQRRRAFSVDTEKDLGEERGGQAQNFGSEETREEECWAAQSPREATN